MIWIYFDIVHRLVRDVKLAVEACDSIHRALLHFSYICSLNGKPFGSGVWYSGPTSMYAYHRVPRLIAHIISRIGPLALRCCGTSACD